VDTNGKVPVAIPTQDIPKHPKNIPKKHPKTPKNTQKNIPNTSKSKSIQNIKQHPTTFKKTCKNIQKPSQFLSEVWFSQGTIHINPRLPEAASGEGHLLKRGEFTDVFFLRKPQKYPKIDSKRW